MEQLCLPFSLNSVLEKNPFPLVTRPGVGLISDPGLSEPRFCVLLTFGQRNRAAAAPGMWDAVLSGASLFRERV